MVVKVKCNWYAFKRDIGIICPSWFCFVSLSPRVRVRRRRGAAVPVHRLPQVLHAEVRAQFARKNTYGLVAHIFYIRNIPFGTRYNYE